jgi:DNA-binding winged helix-turn-helix (wHTH) protein
MIRIGPLHVDLARRELFLDDKTARLGSRAFDVLAVLIGANGSLVSKDDLRRLVWPNTIVEENNLPVHMSALRKLLGDSRGLIQTVSGRGYRLIVARSADASNLVEQESAGGPPHNNLPSNPSALIGRGDAIEDIARALAADRHVTLVGRAASARRGWLSKLRAACWPISATASIWCHSPPRPIQRACSQCSRPALA